MSKQKAEQIIEEAKAAPDVMAVEKAQQNALRWRRKYKEAISLAEMLERRVDAIEEIQKLTERRAFTKQVQKSRRGVAAIIPANDWHIEERIYADRTNGLNYYDLAEAEKRVRKFYSQALYLIDQHSSMARVSEIWHPMLGDMISGYIHDELVETNQLSPTQATWLLDSLISAGIDLWLKETKLPIFIPACVGNHGRTTDRGRHKTAAQNSYEWLMYQHLAKRYKGNPRVHWFIEEGKFSIHRIQGWKVRFHHGDVFRYAGGVGGIGVPVNRGVADLNKIVPAHIDVFGHFHQFLPTPPNWVCCPALPGYSEFAMGIRGHFQIPGQAFIIVDKEWGMTEAKTIHVTDRPIFEKEELS